MGTVHDISTAKLANGEHVALGCIEITAIPHYTVIDENATGADAVIERCTREGIDCLGEIYQLYLDSAASI